MRLYSLSFFILFFSVSCINFRNGKITIDSNSKKISNESRINQSLQKNQRIERNLEVTQREQVELVRKEKMISRYNCQGLLESRKYETINSVSAKVIVNYENRNDAWSFEVYNRRTNTSGGGITRTKGAFIIDMAPTVFNTRVKSGINLVEYTFKKCTKIERNENNAPRCVGEEKVEKEGIVEVDVIYSVETVSGEGFIHPSKDECKPSPK